MIFLEEDVVVLSVVLGRGHGGALDEALAIYLHTLHAPRPALLCSVVISAHPIFREPSVRGAAEEFVIPGRM